MLFFLWIISPVIAAAAAREGRRGCGFLLGFLLGPIGIIIAVLLPADTTDRDYESLCRDLADLNLFISDKATSGIMLNVRDARIIEAVTEGSPAWNVGVRGGDRLISVNNVMCDGNIRNTVLSIVGNAGDTVHLKLYRNTETTFFKGEKRVINVDIVLA